MLASPAECRPLLRCPATGASLTFEDDGSATTPDARRYPAVGGVPILIDFTHSVADPEAVLRSGATSVERENYSGLKARLKRLVSPAKDSTRANVRQLIELVKQNAPKPRVLVIGGGTIGQGMHALYEDPALSIIAFDIYGSGMAQFIADAHAIPLINESVDAVVVQAVLEHVLDPAQVVDEIRRVLKPDGLVYAETPFLQQVHEAAFDFTRFTESGHRYLFRRFSLISSGPSAGPGTALLWSLDYFVRALTRSRAAGKAVKLGFFWLHYLDRFIPSDHGSDAASGVFFLGRKSAQEITPREAIAFYRGAQRVTGQADAAPGRAA